MFDLNLNYDMDKSTKLVAIAGKTSSKALITDDPFDEDCYLELYPFFQVR